MRNIQALISLTIFCLIYCNMFSPQISNIILPRAKYFKCDRGIISIVVKYFKLICHMPFTYLFNAIQCIFKVHTLVPTEMQ